MSAYEGELFIHVFKHYFCSDGKSIKRRQPATLQVNGNVPVDLQREGGAGVPSQI